MSRMIAVLSALGIAGMSTAALASEVIDGIVSLIDEENKVIQLVSGEEFKVEGTHELTDVEIGEDVTITYEEQNGENVLINLNQAEPND